MYTGIERITPECPVLVAFRSLLGSLILLISIFIILSFEFNVACYFKGEVVDSQLSQCFGIFCENKNPAYEHSFYI